MSHQFAHLSIKEDPGVLIATGAAAILSILGTGFCLFLYAKYKKLRSFAFKLVSMLNLVGFLQSMFSILYTLLAVTI